MVNFIHVGLYKTGTTWLQSGLFSDHPNIEIIGKPNRAKTRALNQLLNQFMATPPEKFDRQRWLAEFTRLRQALPDQQRILGISDERLCGSVFALLNGLTRADQLCDLFGPVKIILALRHPYTYIASAYSQSVKEYTTISFDAAVRVHQEQVLARLNYRMLVEKYETLFGKENLLLLPYELLVDTPDRFTNLICQFLDIPQWHPSDESRNKRKNERMSLPSTYLFYRANAIDARLSKLLGRKIKHTNRIVRLMQRLNPLEPYLPRMKKIDPQKLHALPRYDELLRAENYAFWDDDLAKYNYSFLNTIPNPVG